MNQPFHVISVSLPSTFFSAWNKQLCTPQTPWAASLHPNAVDLTLQRRLTIGN
jgi:hypothetical protein